MQLQVPRYSPFGQCWRATGTHHSLLLLPLQYDPGHCLVTYTHCISTCKAQLGRCWLVSCVVARAYDGQQVKAQILSQTQSKYLLPSTECPMGSSSPASSTCNLPFSSLEPTGAAGGSGLAGPPACSPPPFRRRPSPGERPPQRPPPTLVSYASSSFCLLQPHSSRIAQPLPSSAPFRCPLSFIVSRGETRSSSSIRLPFAHLQLLTTHDLRLFSPSHPKDSQKGTHISQPAKRHQLARLPASRYLAEHQGSLFCTSPLTPRKSLLLNQALSFVSKSHLASQQQSAPVVEPRLSPTMMKGHQEEYEEMVEIGGFRRHNHSESEESQRRILSDHMRSNRQSRGHPDDYNTQDYNRSNRMSRGHPDDYNSQNYPQSNRHSRGYPDDYSSQDYMRSNRQSRGHPDDYASPAWPPSAMASSPTLRSGATTPYELGGPGRYLSQFGDSRSSTPMVLESITPFSCSDMFCASKLTLFVPGRTKVKLALLDYYLRVVKDTAKRESIAVTPFKSCTLATTPTFGKDGRGTCTSLFLS